MHPLQILRDVVNERVVRILLEFLFQIATCRKMQMKLLVVSECSLQPVLTLLSVILVQGKLLVNFRHMSVVTNLGPTVL